MFFICSSQGRAGNLGVKCTPTITGQGSVLFHALRLPAKAGAQDKLANGKGAKIFKRFADGRDAYVLR